MPAIEPDACLSENSPKRNFKSLCQRLNPSFCREILPVLVEKLFDHAVRSIGADEGSIWVTDESLSHLIPVYNNGPRAADMLESVKQPRGEGIIWMAYELEQGFIENEAAESEDHSKIVDELMKQSTHSIIAMPLYFAGNLRGILSCVQITYKNEGPVEGCRPATSTPSPPSNFERKHFSGEDLNTLELFSKALGQLIELRLHEVVAEDSDG